MDILEFIHKDIYGSFLTNAWSSQQHFIMLINDFFKYGCIYLIHGKPQPLDVLKIFKDKDENQLNKRIKSVKSDHGGKYKVDIKTNHVSKDYLLNS